MSLTIQQSEAIYKLYPQTISIDGTIAYNAEGNEIAYDLQAVNAQAEADAQAVINTKASALAKLFALGLTEDEIKSILGVA
jgi:hypothetical protein